LLPSEYTIPFQLILPALFALGLLLPIKALSTRKGAWIYSATTSTISFLFTLYVASQFNWSDAGSLQFVGEIPWVPGWDLGFNYGMDGMSLWLVMLTTFLMPIVVLGSLVEVRGDMRTFHFWLHILEAALIGTFIARDIIFFYVCFEFTLIPLFFLIGIFGHGEKLKAARVFFFYTFTASLLTMAGVLYVAWFNTTLDPASVPRLEEIGLNGSVLLITLGVSLLSGLLFGILPAFRAGSKKAVLALRDGGRGSTIGRERHRARATLVVGQVSLALMLLIGSGLMVRSFQELSSVDPGFEAEGLMTFRLTTPPSKYPTPEESAQFFEDLRMQLSEKQGVIAVSGINTLPLTGGGAILTAAIDDHPIGDDEFPPAFLARRAMPGYFTAMGVPIIEGRDFIADDHNARLGSRIISESVNSTMLKVSAWCSVYSLKPSSVTIWSSLPSSGSPDAACSPKRPRAGIGLPVSCSEMKIAGMV